MYVNVNHDLTQSLENKKSRSEKNTCTNEHNNIDLDDCLFEVSNKFLSSQLSKTLDYSNLLKGIDKIFLQLYGCVLPFQTLKPDEKKCLLNSTLKSQYNEFIYTSAYANCGMPCLSMEINFPPLSFDTGPSDQAYVKMYLLSVIKVQKSYWSYPIISLLAEVGGYMGLLLGISLLDLSKVVHWLYLHYPQRFK